VRKSKFSESQIVNILRSPSGGVAGGAEPPAWIQQGDLLQVEGAARANLKDRRVVEC